MATLFAEVGLTAPPSLADDNPVYRADDGILTVRHANGAKGDLIADVQIVLPASADAAATATLLEAARAAEASDPQPPRAALSW